MKSYKHSGDIGDIIYTLPVIKHYGKGNLYLNKTYNKKLGPRGIDNTIINSLIPLLKQQSYINEVKIWENEKINVDLDSFRVGKIIKRKNLCHFILNHFHIPTTYTDKGWLFAEDKKISKTVFHRSFRYRNKSATPILKKYLGKDPNSIFVGFKNEWHDFYKTIGKISHYPTANLWDLACVIQGSELFIGNQSAPMSIAIALNKKIVQEVCPSIPDCIFDNRNNITYIK